MSEPKRLSELLPEVVGHLADLHQRPLPPEVATATSEEPSA